MVHRSPSCGPPGAAGVATPFAGGADVRSGMRAASRPPSSTCLGVIILRKEVIQPQVPLRLPCYDLVPIRSFTFGACV
jgi:hypothetical protein